MNERALFLKTIVLKSPPARTFTSRAVFELLIDVAEEKRRAEREKREREERRGEERRDEEEEKEETEDEE